MEKNITNRLKNLRYFTSLEKSRKLEIRELQAKCYTTRQSKHEIEAIQENIAQLNCLIDEMYLERELLTAAIEQLDPLEKIIIRLYYINGYSWRMIEIELNHKRRNLQEYRKKGIEKLTKILHKNS